MRSDTLTRSGLTVLGLRFFTTAIPFSSYAIDTAWSSYELSGEGRCAYQLTSLIETVEYLIEEGKPAGDMPALEEERKREERFLTSRRNAEALCASLRAKYKEYVGCELDSSP